MSHLALAIYEALRGVVQARQPHISYSGLVSRLGPMPVPNEDLQARDPRLDEALGELVTACRNLGLPAISALVVRDKERVPGPGYYTIAHPDEAHDKERAIVAWGREAERARIEPYPERL